MASHDYQDALIVGDLKKYLVHQTFTELTVVQGLNNYFDISTHVR